jgi:hypothetical protein
MTAGTSLNAALRVHVDPSASFVQRSPRESLRLITRRFERLPVDLFRHRDPIVFSMVRDPDDYDPSLWRYLREMELLGPSFSFRDWLVSPISLPNRQAHAIPVRSSGRPWVRRDW